MPAQPHWLLHLPEIIAEIGALATPVVDRAVLERVFRVRRRRAIELMGAFGGYQAGRTFLLERQQLLAALDAMRQGGRFTFERRRKEKLAQELERVRRSRAGARIAIPVEKEDLAGFPPGVELAAGRLTIAFASVEDLLRKLYGLAQAAASDFEAFENAAGPR